MVDFHSFRTNYQDKSEPGGFYQKPGTNIRRTKMNKEIDAGTLIRFIERIENLEQDATQIAEDIKEVFSQAKAQGYDTKAIKKCILLRKKNIEDINREEEILQLYRKTLGI